MSDSTRSDDLRNGIRFPWNFFPQTSPSTDLFPLPLSSLYTPFAPLDEMSVLEYAPVECSKCKAVLNPYSKVDFHRKVWGCQMCFAENNLPYTYHGITEYNLPPELLPVNTTVEYVPSKEAITAKIVAPVRSKRTNPQDPSSNVPEPPTQPPSPYRHPVLIFVLDTSLIEEELSALKTTLVQAIHSLPDDIHIGLITYGKNVEIHDLFAERFSKSYSFQGTNKHGDIQRDFKRIRQRVPITQMVCPLSECLMHIVTIIQHLERDPWEYNPVAHRPLRCTGTALHIASLMYQALTAHDNGRYNTRIMLFTGGVATIGDGATAEIGLHKPLRSHVDIARNQLSPQFKTSKEYYYQLALQVLADSHATPYASCVFDIFACCLDQVGLAEMSSIVQLTNGQIVLDDSFSHGVFRGSIKHILSPVADQFTDIPLLPMAFHGELSIYTSKNLRIQSQPPLLSNLMKSSTTGGPTSKLASFLTSSSSSSSSSTTPTTGTLNPDEAASLAGKLASSNAITKIGAANTKNPYDYITYLNHGVGFDAPNIPISHHIQHWVLGAISPSTTIVTIFTPNDHIPQQARDWHTCYFQYKTRYIDGLGREVIRVTTIEKPFKLQTQKGSSDGNDVIVRELRDSFDQDAAMALLTRIAVAKSHSTYSTDVLRWVETTLVQFGRRYGNYIKTDPHSSFSFSPQFSMLPQYVFYLRRSQLLRVFNSSPDETAFFRLISQTETTEHILLMIQPQLTAYAINAPPTALPLDTSSLDSRKILFLDTYFHVVLWYGQVIAQWKEQNLHLQPEYSYLADLMKAPLRQAKICLETRFPTPRFIECIERGSQSRFLTAKLANTPSGSDGTTPTPATADDLFTQHGIDGDEPLPAMFSEDLSLKAFIDQFKAQVVNTPKQKQK